MSTKSLNLPLLTWNDPVKTGKVFGSLIAALVVFKSVNLLSLFFRIASVALFASAIAEYGGKLVLGQGLVTKFKPATTNKFSAHASKALEKIAKDLPCLESEGQKLLYAANIENTAKSAGLFYILYKITSWVSLYTLVFTAVIAAFTAPFIYEKYQVEIDAAVKQASEVAVEKYHETSKIVGEKAAPYLKQADEKLGPVSSFIKQKYQVRTAGSTVAAEPNATAFSSSSATASSKNPFESATKEVPVEAPATSFPDVPKTEPQLHAGNSFVDQVKEVAQEASETDINDLKEDLLKNKEAAINAQF